LRRNVMQRLAALMTILPEHCRFDRRKLTEQEKAQPPRGGESGVDRGCETAAVLEGAKEFIVAGTLVAPMPGLARTDKVQHGGTAGHVLPQAPPLVRGMTIGAE